jgi:hypothetical protein
MRELRWRSRTNGSGSKKITPKRFEERPGATFWKQNFGEKILPLPSTGKTVVSIPNHFVERSVRV